MPAVVRYREFWGANKRAELLASLEDGDEPSFVLLAPEEANRFALRPVVRAADYAEWAPLPQLSLTPGWSGCLEKRKGTLMDGDPERLRTRMARYCDPAIPFDALRAEGCGPAEDAARFDARRARAALLQAGGIAAGRIARISLYPFDDRWCFHTNIRPIWNEPRPEVAAQQAAGNSFLVSRRKARRPDEGLPAFFTRALPGDHLLDPNAHPIPFVLHDTAAGSLGLTGGGATRPNLSPLAIAWLDSLGLPATPETSRLVWLHALATTTSPAYLAGHGPAIRDGWPRIPLPGDADLLHASAALGAQVAALLDPDTPVPGVTAGTIRPELAAIAVPATQPGAARDWRLLNWGNRTDKGVTMPGRGQSSLRNYAPEEAATAAQAALLGARTLDIGMNSASLWKNIPEAVWETPIGGYQVLKKWLSYRDVSILGRALTGAEVQHVTDTARRLAALRLLGPELDASHGACAAAHVSPA